MKLHLADELGEVLPERIKKLSKLIARKPNSFTEEWAATPDEAFKLYTRTSTINLLMNINDFLIEYGYPFPAYINIKSQLNDPSSSMDWHLAKKKLRLIKTFRNPTLFDLIYLSIFFKISLSSRHFLMERIFDTHQNIIFDYISNKQILSEKIIVIKEIKKAYKKKLWAACITTAMPLLDYIIRSYCETDSLRVSLQTLRKAFFEKAELSVDHLKPGYAILDEKYNPEKEILENKIIHNVEEDLRISGIYLASFFEFLKRYYESYDSAKTRPASELNRHAIMHGASSCWTKINAVCLLTFLHLTLQLEAPLKILLHSNFHSED